MAAISLSISGSPSSTTLSIGSKIYIGTIVGSSIVSGVGAYSATFIATASGSSLVLGIGRGIGNTIGSILGSSTIYVDNPGTPCISVINSNSIVTSTGTNTGNGIITGSSISVVDNSVVISNIIGNSLVFGEGKLRSRFAPFDIFPNYSIDNDNIVIPISELPGISTAEADSISGSWIDIFQAICIADHIWMKTFTTSTSPITIHSWNNRNMNVKSSKFQYGIGELNTFLKNFTVTYSITNLVDEN